MATYKGIQGYSVQKLSSDPTASEVEGQLFYNSSTGKFKISVAGTGAWSSGGTMNNGRNHLKGGGIQTAAIMAGGNSPSVNAYTETYDGSAWTETADLNTGRGQTGPATQGTTTAFLLAGGSIGTAPTNASNETETFNGTAWTEVNNLNTARRALTGGGTTTAAIAVGGQTAPNNALGNTETYNGTSWTEKADLNNVRNGASGCGTSTAALTFVGRVPPSFSSTNKTESWNGSSWTEVANTNTARNQAAGIGIQTAALLVGGAPSPAKAFTESWNGSSWTEVADLGSGQYGLGGSGTSSLGLVGAGEPAITSSEEWNDPVYTIKTVTVS